MSWQEIDRLFHSAAALAPQERPQFLDAECSGDPDLRKLVESLLESAETAESFLNDIILRGAAAISNDHTHPLEGSRLGDYEILHQLGRGGMGEVFLARRADREFDKQVAVKLMRVGLDPGARRFLQERQILARLEHPNIARLLDGGTAPDGRPFLVMEYVEGVPVTQYCAEHDLSTNDCCHLFLQVCSAVEYAHRNLIVHRDIKPGNILVDAAGTPKLLDFGIAKLLEDDADATIAAARPLTPHYAAPEQRSGGVITTATDVYLLGEVLFEMLTRQRWAERNNSDNKSLLPADLHNVLLRALHDEPERRYSSVEQFALDIRRYLEGRPVSARPDTLGYRFAKLIRRHPATSAIAALLVLSIALGVASTIRQQRRAERRFAEVRQMANVFLFDFENAIRDIPGTADARQLVIRTGLQYLENLSREAAGDPVLVREVANAYVKMGDLQGPGTTSSVSVKGSVATAAESYRHALDLLHGIDAGHSRDPLLRGGYIDALLSYADVEGDADLKAGLRDAEEALRLAEDLARSQPGDRRALKLVVDSGMILSRLQQRSDSSAAVVSAQKAIAAGEELVRRFPGEPRMANQAAAALMRLSMVESDRRDWPAVARDGAKAVEILERLHAATPADKSLAKSLVIAYIQLGKGLFSDAVQRTSGLDYLRKSVDLAESIHASDPNSPDALTDFSGIHSVYGDRLSRSGDLDSATPYLERGVKAAEFNSSHDPENESLRSTWAIDLTMLAAHQRRQKNYAAAIQTRRKVEEIFSESLRKSPSDVRVLRLAALNELYLGENYLDSRDSATAHRSIDRASQTVETLRKASRPGTNLDDLVRDIEAVRKRLTT